MMLLKFSAILIGFSSLLNAQSTVSTPIVGFENKAVNAGTTAMGVGFVKPTVFSGTASSISSTVISVSAGSFGNFAPVNGLPTHYALLTSGGMAGFVLDILANTTSSITIDADLTPILGTTPQFKIIPHTKLSDVFNGNTSLSDYVDTVTVYHSDGTPLTLLRDSSAATGWVDGASFAEADSVIYPGQGFLLATSGNASVSTSGQVRSNTVKVPLYASGVNLVSVSNPGANPNIQSINLGQDMADFVDTFGTFSSDGLNNQNANYLWGGVTDGFISPDTFAPITNVNVQGTSAILVNVSSDLNWNLPPPVSP